MTRVLSFRDYEGDRLIQSKLPAALETALFRETAATIHLLTQATTEEQVRHNLMDITSKLTGASGVAIGHYLDGKIHFDTYFREGAVQDLPELYPEKNFVFEPGRGVPGRVIESKRGYVCQDAFNTNMKGSKQVLSEMRDLLGFSRLINVPLVVSEGENVRLLGCFEVHRPEKTPLFSALEYECLVDVATNAAMSIARLQLLSEREELIARLEYLADHDPLTGALNRRGFANTMNGYRGLDRRVNGGDTLLMLDIDNFKSINDTITHNGGDGALKDLCNVMHTHLTDILRPQLHRKGDVVDPVIGRFGGDEFNIYLQGCREEGAMKVAENLRRKIEATCFQYRGESYNLTVTIGVVPITDQTTSTNHVLNYASSIITRMKREKGRNRVTLYRMEE